MAGCCNDSQFYSQLMNSYCKFTTDYYSYLQEKIRVALYVQKAAMHFIEGTIF